jgi:hypothetical protein
MIRAGLQVAEEELEGSAHTRQTGVVFRRPHGFFQPGKTRPGVRIRLFSRLTPDLKTKPQIADLISARD